MGIFARLFGSKKPPTQQQHGPKLHVVPAEGKQLQASHMQKMEGYRRRTTKGKKKSPHTTQTNAAFNQEEMGAFILGLPVQCRSSWIQEAQWSEGANELYLTTKGTGKRYTFPSVGWEDAQDFAKSFSKGQWYWIEWVGAHGIGGPVALETADMPAGKSRRIL